MITGTPNPSWGSGTGAGDDKLPIPAHPHLPTLLSSQCSSLNAPNKIPSRFLCIKYTERLGKLQLQFAAYLYNKNKLQKKAWLKNTKKQWFETKLSGDTGGSLASELPASAGNGLSAKGSGKHSLKGTILSPLLSKLGCDGGKTFPSHL